MHSSVHAMVKFHGFLLISRGRDVYMFDHMKLHGSAPVERFENLESAMARKEQLEKTMAWDVTVVGLLTPMNTGHGDE